ncbi:hypothetical protein RvY_04161 [Ramazzottius varieornatus]|uniref:Uncharacterized protein n=1 Tax=Ramazzottius varieornatus TaxID=947166 RepID=A0A1D1URD2_RAMVA|nr:hypothetical protein RvY_04161 [Ramazzottius varieornatus]
MVDLPGLSTTETKDSDLPQLTVADFQNTMYLNCTPDTPLYKKLDMLSQTLPLTIKDLKNIPTESAMSLIAECFVKKGCFIPYYPNLGVEITHMRHIALRPFWPRLQKNAYSFGLVDSSGRLMGVATNFDAVDFPSLPEYTSPEQQNSKHSFITQIHEYLDNLCNRAKDQLPDESQLERGAMLDKYMYGIPFNALTPSENLYVMYRLMEETHRRAVEHGFQYCMSENSHPYTQNLALFFGCDRLVTDHAHDYVNSKGEKPFDLVPEKIVVTLDLKTYPKRA